MADQWSVGSVQVTYLEKNGSEAQIRYPVESASEADERILAVFARGVWRIRTAIDASTGRETQVVVAIPPHRVLEAHYRRVQQVPDDKDKTGTVIEKHLEIRGTGEEIAAALLDGWSRKGSA